MTRTALAGLHVPPPHAMSWLTIAVSVHLSVSAR
jgi:hypothetical protein